MCFEVAGTLLGIGVYTVFYTSLVQNKKEDCSDGERQPDEAMRATFRYHALTLGVLTFFFILTTFIGVREQQGQSTCMLASSLGHSHVSLLRTQKCYIENVGAAWG